jgi:co-chaperonin GroES (HSP10)
LGFKSNFVTEAYNILIHEDNIVKSKGKHQQTVSGIIIPEKWDDKNNVIGVSIQAFDESEYIVNSCLDDKDLFDFIKKKVKVAGKVFERSDGKFNIEVNHFEVMDN